MHKLHMLVHVFFALNILMISAASNAVTIKVASELEAIKVNGTTITTPTWSTATAGTNPSVTTNPTQGLYIELGLPGDGNTLAVGQTLQVDYSFVNDGTLLQLDDTGTNGVEKFQAGLLVDGDMLLGDKFDIVQVDLVRLASEAGASAGINGFGIVSGIGANTLGSAIVSEDIGPGTVGATVFGVHPYTITKLRFLITNTAVAGNTGTTSGKITGVALAIGNVGKIHYTVPPVPIPSATWLFGSGLLGLIGIARRKIA